MLIIPTLHGFVFVKVTSTKDSYYILMQIWVGFYGNIGIIVYGVWVWVRGGRRVLRIFCIVVDVGG